VAVVLLLMGIVSDATNIKMGLDASNWLLLGIAAVVAAVFFRHGQGDLLEHESARVGRKNCLEDCCHGGPIFRWSCR